jgi:hypothetical protein
MPQACTACHHPEREAIDAAIVERQSYRAIARQWGLSKVAVARHVAHVSRALTAIAADREEAAAGSLRERVEGLIRRTEVFLAAAEKTGAVAQGLAAVRELRALLELLGKASGELKPEGGPSVSVNVLASPEIVQVTTVLMRALAPYPQARIAVADALEADGLEVPA